jgi:hypothetical protein
VAILRLRGNRGEAACATGEGGRAASAEGEGKGGRGREGNRGRTTERGTEGKGGGRRMKSTSTMRCVPSYMFSTRPVPRRAFSSTSQKLTFPYSPSLSAFQHRSQRHSHRSRRNDRSPSPFYAASDRHSRHSRSPRRRSHHSHHRRRSASPSRRHRSSKHSDRHRSRHDYDDDRDDGYCRRGRGGRGEERVEEWRNGSGYDEEYESGSGRSRRRR